MGWFGYGLYDGDETQTLHIDFIKTAIPSLSKDYEIFEFLKVRKTLIPRDLILEFKKGIPSILKKIKNPKKWNDDIAIQWQMLLSLCVDNDLIVPHDILVYGVLASYYLLRDHAEDFNEPHKRRATLKRFIKKVDDLYCSVKARKTISRLKNKYDYSI